MKIKYSPSAKERLVQLKKTKHQETVNKIVITIKSLIFNPERCPKVENMFGIKLRSDESIEYWGE